ncbi:uncharacterized protein LOC125492868 [Beta vulgaris subsp. vulgaris]|uniref:uncharacterized protein LOC125492868 n=1 Tax=Beta vulgaris subsp. vulgaris TaxID=3555 RepID=UPI00053FB37D|nr:uncharacterized protein LOC125492868 [Beta vulgaris subsp. vulgaris]
MSAMSWNCKGLTDSNLHPLGFFPNAISTYNLDFIFLSETKSQVSVLEPIFNRLGFPGCTGMNSEFSKGANLAGNEYFMLFVYGSPYLAERDSIWSQITDLMGRNQGRWVLLGDFNQYTWTNNRKDNEVIYERIDKVFSNNQWRDLFPDAEVWNLPIVISDHSPIVLITSGTQGKKKKRPYRLDAWSLKHPEVTSIIQNQWASIHQGSSAHILQRKIQDTLREIRNWSLSYKSKNKIDWNDIHEKLSNQQAHITNISQGELEQKLRKEIKEDLQGKFCYWKQRAKSRWDDSGDKTTQFFYKSVKGRKSRNEIKAIKDDSGYLLKEQNKTFITLIPKKDRPQEVKDFRPISLCNTSYKIIATTLANKLKSILGDIVDKYQNAFVSGRQMSDNCFISHEIINWVKNKKKGNNFAGILKVDLSKAYDRIRWDFVEAILRKMKFPENWVQWIMQCITTVTYSILINGEPSKVFKPLAGLRQGDPLSSYIFILCMEVLSRSLTQAQDIKTLEGLKIARNAPKITHLLFADDALFFFKALPKNCWALRDIINNFCRASGEMINFDKSHVIFSPNTPLKFTRIMRRPLGVSS